MSEQQPIEPISDIQELNDLRERCLRGEDIPPEKYLAVLEMVRKVRRARGDPAVEPKTPRGAKKAPVALPSLEAILGPRDQ